MAVIKRKINKEKYSLGTIEEIEKAFEGDFPFPLNNLLDILDIELEEKKLNNEQSGYITYKDDKWIIGVNEDHHINRQRFTIAHEIGHYILHNRHIMDSKIMEDTILFRNDDTNELEISANNFASMLLMPEDEFNKQIDQGNDSVESLAEYFGVSTLAIQYRAKDLGYNGNGV